MAIIAREPECKLLTDLYERPQAVFIAIYGRMQAGKTFLIHSFFKDKGLFFEIKGHPKASKKEQLKNFHRELISRFPETDTTLPTDWGEAFYRLKNAFGQIDEKQKIILFLDELPWLAANRSGFLSALEYIWNRHFSRQQNLILIVCGSAASWMIKKIINNHGGLYGRLTRSIPLYPFNLQDVEQFLLAKNIQFDRKQIVELFMTTGGVAAYLENVPTGRSVVQIVNELCYKPSAPLFLEFNNLFQSLFKNHQKHIDIVTTLATKRRGLTQTQLLKAVNLPQSGRSTDILNELEACGFIQSVPMFGKTAQKKKFRLIDEYSYFFLSWIQPKYQDILNNADPEYWHKIYNSSAWLSWAGFAFENICLKHISKIKQALGIAAVNTTQSYWQHIPKKGDSQDGAEIDLIIDRDDGCINLCEIKFTNNTFKLDKQYAKKLTKKREVFREKTKTKKSLFITLITPYGALKNEHYNTLVNSQVTIDDLF